ncbi:zinc-binding dehydrogenase [Pseudokordiimonas caeni]|uniref:zinc-binding dehydrogenase n=1 Tax=Pseudokordiimonas caeni TaxID=2997908 RepID=UPI002810C82F|nr:zinc-binding dehydrogenase [Pseudokordiimonas caeni]
MKAVVCQNGKLTVETMADPVPQQGQLLLRVERCGICGSDLHARQDCGHWADLVRRAGYNNFMRPDDRVVFGHEFCGEVLEAGGGVSRGFRAGTRVVAMPVMRHGAEIDMIGFSPRTNGAYAERLCVDASLAFPVPNGLSADLAALTEPMAVGWHAIRRSEIKAKDVAIVVGCGPIGLAVICGLKARGVKTVIASDFSPGRRKLAEACGADIVIDPAQGSPYADWRSYGFVGELQGLFELAFDTREVLGKLPLPWWHVWRIAEALGAAPKRPVIFECVGVPGVLNSIIEGAPLFSRIIVVGVCMQSDTIEPSMGIHKEIDLRFVLGYSPVEFRDVLHMIAVGRLDPSPLVTGTVGLDGVAGAFDALKDPEKHAKILVDPGHAG